MARRKKPRRIVEEFESYFGSGTLDDWQRLCRDIGLEGDLNSITKCRKALLTVHINIYDLLDAVREGREPRRFPNAQQLAAYAVGTGRIYPKRHVKKMGPVKALMRHIL